jgi:hypothetical protein
VRVNLPLDFAKARIEGVVLAKVGNPARNEPLQTSKTLFHVSEEDQPLLTPIFLRPFRNLVGHRFQHHTALEQHPLNQCATAIFHDPATLLQKGQEIARRLYAKSHHPNIKSGDLCVAHIQGIGLEGGTRRGLCILKSESVTPFLSISTQGDDLALHTEQGIHPERLDKGCLIVEHFEAKGFYVLNFDRAGAESRFWMRDFLGVVPIADPGLVSRRVAEMAVAAVSERGDEAADEAPWERQKAAQNALGYFESNPHFSLAEFEEQALRTPEARARFAAEKQRVEEDEGLKFEDGFTIAKREASKARRLTSTTLRLDSGVELRIKPQALDADPPLLEKGYDEQRDMQFVKVYYRREV